MRIRRTLMLSALFCLTAAPVAFGQEPVTGNGRLRGRLLNPDTGLPEVGVRLSLVEPGQHDTITRADGLFEFRGIPPATYRYLFAYARGEREPAETILLKKQVNVAAITGTAANFSLRQLLERPEDVQPKVRRLTYKDNRPRTYTRSLVVAEPLGLKWQQYLSVPMRFEIRKCRRPSLCVMDGTSGDELPHQLTEVEYYAGDFVKSCIITFPATLLPFDRKIYVFASDDKGGFQPFPHQTDLKLETRENTGERVLSNSLVSLLLPPPSSDKPLPAAKCPAPVLALRGPDNVWFGRGSLIADRPVESFTCEESETGPVFREFKTTYKFAEVKAEKKEDALPAAEYEVTVRLFAGRDYALIREAMTGKVDVTFRFSLKDNFGPTRAMFVKDGRAAFAGLTPPPGPEPLPLAVFRAWNPAGLRKSHNWFGLTTSGNRKDAVGLVQVAGAQWDFEKRPLWGDGAWLNAADDREEIRLFTTKQADVYFDFPHRAGTRQVALVVFDKTKNWDPVSLTADPLPPNKRHYLNMIHIRQSQMSLSRLLAIRTERGRLRRRPSLLFNPRTFKTLKEQFDKDPSQFPDVLHDVFTGERTHTTLIRNLILGSAVQLRDAFLGEFAQNPSELSGFCSVKTHPAQLEQILKFAALLYDANARSNLFSVREREAIRSSFVLAAAQLDNLNYLLLYGHDPEAAARRDCALSVTSLILNHPLSSTRILSAKDRLVGRYGLLTRAASTGGLPLDTGATLRAMNVWANTAPTLESATGITRVGGSPFDWGRYVDSLERLSRLTTPPDKRYGGTRLLPSLGHSRAGERDTLALMGLAAAKLALRYPTLAPRLTWAWEQAGRPLFGQPTRHQALLNVLDLLPKNIEAKPPTELKTEILPGLGALMRSRFGEPDEAYLLFKCSPFPYGRHADQLSLIFHAFGTPLLVDSGSPPERSATWAHNTVRIDSRRHTAPGQLRQFYGQDSDDYVMGDVEVKALGRLKEYTVAELRAAAAAAADKKKPFVPPPGHRLDGTETTEMLTALQDLDQPVLVQRHVLFNRDRQYAVVLDRVKGTLPVDLFYNVLADDARVQGHVARFVGPFGVDCDIHAFGPQGSTATVHKDLPQRWTFRLAGPPPVSPAPPTEQEPGEKPEAKPADKPADGEPAPPDDKTAEEKPEPPTLEFITVICPIRRADGNRPGIKEYAAPIVDRLTGVTGVRLRYGGLTRLVFLSDKEVEYKDGDVYFRGTRGALTIWKTHFELVLYEKGELRFRNQGVKTEHGMVRFAFAPGGFVKGEVSGPTVKRLTVLGLDRGLGKLSFRTDGLEYIPDGNAKEALYGVAPGQHTVTIGPK